jgi:hypothetical protein
MTPEQFQQLEDWDWLHRMRFLMKCWRGIEKDIVPLADIVSWLDTKDPDWKKKYCTPYWVYALGGFWEPEPLPPQLLTK